MAVTSVTENVDNADGAWNRLYQRRYTRSFNVECDAHTDGPVTIRATTNGSGQPHLPAIGNSYFVTSTEKDLGSFACDITYTLVRRGTNPEGSSWTVTVVYEPYDSGFFGPNPVSWPGRLSFGQTKFERSVEYDQAGVAIINSAFERFEDPVVLDDSRSVITFVRNELISTFDFTLAEAYRDKVNSATWNGFGPKTVKIGSITTGDPVYDSNNNVYYYEVTYVFEVNRDAWRKVLLDHGYSVLDSSSPPKPKPVLVGGQKVEKSILLDGSGHQLATTGTPVFLNFDVYPSAAFSGLSIDFSTVLGR